MSCETQNVDIVFNDTTAQNVKFDDSTALALTFNDTVNQDISCAKFTASDPDYYTDTVVATLGAGNIVAHYRLDETSGTTAADASGTLDATYVNAPTLGASTLLAGGSGGGTSVDFDGSNDHVSFSGSILFDYIHRTGVFTASCWVNVDSNSGIDAVFANTTGSVLPGLALEVTAGTLTARFANGSNDFTASTSITFGTTYHVAITGDGSTMRLYLNGSLADSVAITPVNTAQLRQFSLAAYNDTSRFYDGTLDEVTFGSTAATAANVTALYNGGT
jgi:hypothetical protein